MNSGKICISICAETVDELIAQIKRAEEELADIIEVRFDGLKKSELESLLWSRTYPGPSNAVVESTGPPIISTFRPKDQGGCRELDRDERDRFWNSGHETLFCDVEEEYVDDSWSWLWMYRICSFHDFSGVPDDLGLIADRLTRTDAEIIKVAVAADDITDAIPVWKLIEHIGEYREVMRPGIIPIAMGEAGKWTRFLGLAHGSYLTYASLDAGAETADGQIAAREMTETYRVKELDTDTQVFGIIGDPVSQSLSPYFQNPAFVAACVNAVFIPLLVKNLDEFMRRMVKPATREVELNFGGFSVTMPHKQSIMKHLDAIDPIAERIGAVNTVKIEAGKFTGYNTDAHGFITPLKAKFADVKNARVAVFGAGGAARACVYALKQEGADVTVFARDPEKGEALANEFGIASGQLTTDHRKLATDILVDATPLGMKGSLEDRSLFTADELSGVKFVYDLVTSATDTPLISEAKKAGIPTIGGVEMLIAQGAKQFEIWTGREAPVELMRNALKTRLM